MRNKTIYILIYLVTTLFCWSCSDEQVLTTYEEIKQVEVLQTPLSFTPYVGTNIEASATTRADRNYLSNVGADEVGALYNSFPYFKPTNPADPTAGGTGYAGGRSNPYNAPYYDNYRFGKFSNNSYIVGIYGYYNHTWDTDTSIPWSELKDDPNMTANFMTNQPLLHTDASTWTYSPLRYWPNSTMTDNSSDSKPVKVTFVSYYPFQDFKREDPQGSMTDKEYWITNSPYPYYRFGQTIDGEKYADLTCIEPPAKNATGTDAYTFTFTQKENVNEHIDFLLGLTKDKTKQSVTDATTAANGITLNLHHTLCAVMFDIRTKANAIPAGCTITINSFKLEGLYGKGKVRPTTEDFPGVEWSDLENGDTSYILEFTGAEEDFHSDVTEIVKPVFTNAAARLSRQVIYENQNRQGKSTWKYNSSDYLNNKRGMKFLMLVIPQKVTERDTYLVINYDMSYSTGDGTIPNVLYKNNEERIKLYDDKKHSGDTGVDKSQLFLAGKLLTFNIEILSPKEIVMDAAVETDWGEDLQRDVTLPEPGDLSIEEFSFSPIKYTVTSSDLETANAGRPTLHNTRIIGGLPVVYSSTNPSVADVNPATGVFTSIGVNGEATIIATVTISPDTPAYEDLVKFNGKAVSYTLVVAKPEGTISDDELKFTPTTYTVTTDYPSFPVLTNTKNLTVTYSSSDKTVATVRKQTGVVTIMGNGTATISATFAGDKDFEAKTVSYTLIVNKPVFKYSERFYTVTSTAEETTLPVLSHDGIDNNDITYESTDLSVATVASNGIVTVVGNGVTNIIATFNGNENYTKKTAVYTLTVDKP